MTLGTGFMIVATTMPMNMMLEKMSLGMIETVKIFVLTLLFSLPFGLVVAWGRMSRIKIVKWLVNIYISIMRGTPLMLQVMAIYFGPSYLLKIQISRDYRFYAVNAKRTVRSSKYARIQQGTDFYEDYITTGN